MRTHILTAALALIVSACASYDGKVSDAQFEEQRAQAEQYSLNEGFASRVR